MKYFTEEVDRSLDLLFKVQEVQRRKSKQPQLLDKAKYVYLQVMLFRIPYTAPRKRKLVRLRHSLYGDDPEICLFVPNRKTGVEYKKTTDELIDFCVDYYTDFLEKHKVKGISTVMPFKQLRSEYGTYDLRRKLVRRFDLFLCKTSLLYNSKFISSLGKIFKVANKMPFGVPFPKDDADFDPEFQKNIKKAILTSGFYISRFSDNYSIPIGTVANTKKELKENLETVLQQLFDGGIIPGGLQNVRALYLWPSQSKSIPLYMNPEFPVGMKTPRDKIKKKKKLKGVEGELSTQPNKKVVVTPSGEVFVSNLEGKSKKKKVTPEPPEIDFEDDESFKDESDIDEEEDKKENSKAKMRPTGTEEEEEDSESEDDEEIEKREIRLLEEKRQAEEEEEEEEDSEEEEEEEIETNKNLNKNQKSKRKRKNESSDDGTTTPVAKKKKSGKGEQKGKINKAQKKTLMKQQKSKLKEKINNQNRKSKQKKV